ncbi:MAG: TIGR02449 family protein [Methylococcales bacterium]|nr:TIGR02449 family protein [Methylococcales bacterium]
MTEIYLPIELEDFEYNLDKLVGRYLDIKNDNIALKIKQEMLEKENLELLGKVELAKARLDAMITRLKALENS